MTVLSEIEALLQSTARDLGPAVVGLGRGWGTGSGIVIADGRVLTNAHAVRHDEVTVTFADGERRPGTVTGRDGDVDLAVISVDTSEVRAIAWAPPDAAPVAGQAVVALGNPGGRGLRVTFGFVSSVGRKFRGPRGRRIAGALEHTAPLPRGSSGGPLLDTSGRLLGVNSVRVDGGLILAVPGDEHMQQTVQALARGEEPRRARLGVAVAPPRAARELRRAVGLPDRPGLLVRAVQEGSPAEAAGLQRGDLIVRLGGSDTAKIDELHDAVAAAGAGSPVELGVVRGSDEVALSVEF